ncbi:MAG: hypothetical protein JO349_00050, partial [Candidatus Eremiobacteraeota bacterium]|nr:hypothetical protein [Candidatus Eremiobacteraeota bacterium]
MIFDCFTFFDELDLLELRLRVLDPVVDRFVLCEAPFTFRGAPKPLYFREAAERFTAWREKIIHLVYEGPSSSDPWDNEWGQRNWLFIGVENADPDDLVLIGDCDEIPDPKNVARRPIRKPIVAHRQRFSIGYVNRVSPVVWVGTRAILRRNVLHFGSMSEVRKRPESETEAVDGGWHFSSFGGAGVMQRKLQSYSHAEYGIPYYADARRLRVEYASENEARWIAVDDSFPEQLRESRWLPYVWPKPPSVSPARIQALEHAHGCFAYVPAEAQAVIAVSDDVENFTRAGNDRFAGRFAGVETRLDSATDARRAWYVIDGLERQNLGALRALRNAGAGIVAYARNARSYRWMHGALEGGSFPNGRALGISE